MISARLILKINLFILLFETKDINCHSTIEEIFKNLQAEKLFENLKRKNFNENIKSQCYNDILVYQTAIARNELWALKSK